jgi:TPR repeat protein
MFACRARLARVAFAPMRNLCSKAPLVLCMLIAVVGCDPGQKAAAGNREAARSAQGGAPQPRPLTDLEVAQNAYEVGDWVKALEYFLKAAERGDKDAQFYAGVMLADGQGTRRNQKNIPEAVKWYEKAAEQNQPDALYALARFYVLNVGVDADSEKALELYNRAIAAYPPGEKQDRAIEQRNALMNVLHPPPAVQEAPKP